MDDKIAGLAAVIAATELLPAEWYDLSHLLEACGGPDCLLCDEQTGAQEPELLSYIRQSLDRMRLEYWRRKLSELVKKHPSVSIATVTDPAYPENLRICYDRPPFVFIDGPMGSADRRALAIVGSRTADAKALSVAREVATSAAAAGVTIVSGLARGVDAAAHLGVLAAGGRTIAVLPSGIDAEIFPRQHSALAREARAHGALLSQFRPGSPPTRSSFIARNAVISGLSRVSLVVAGGERSGTMSEAENAIKQDRTVMLWEPTMGQQRWAQHFAQLPRVLMVADIPQILGEFK